MIISQGVEPFEGALLIMNIGQGNIGSLDMSKEYSRSICAAIKHAHTKGHLVLYLGDDRHGLLTPPDDFPTLEGMDESRLMGVVAGVSVAFFPLHPKKRMEMFNQMANRIFYNGPEAGIPFFENKSRSSFVFGNWKIVGNCIIDGTTVLHPLTAIDLKKLPDEGV